MNLGQCAQILCQAVSILDKIKSKEGQVQSRLNTAQKFSTPTLNPIPATRGAGQDFCIMELMIEVVNKFTNQGYVISKTSSTDQDILNGATQANAGSFGYHSGVRSSIYGCETWKVTTCHIISIQVFGNGEFFENSTRQQYSGGSGALYQNPQHSECTRQAMSFNFFDKKSPARNLPRRRQSTAKNYFSMNSTFFNFVARTFSIN